jgi:hypothetical protein
LKREERQRKEKGMSVSSYSGGEVRNNAVYGTEVWNRDPLPPPAPPKVHTYKLVVEMGENTAYVKATTIEALIAFELQMRDIGYEFVRMERLD